MLYVKPEYYDRFACVADRCEATCCAVFAVKWAEQDGCLSAKDIQKIVYRYSRELEHSDLNLEVMQNV